jgi:surfeit locus 1 family protein
LTGLLGVAILLSLGVWQVRRLHWKEGILAEITARLNDAPIAVPASPDPLTDNYRAVTMTGHQTGPGLRLWSPPSYQLIVPVETAGRRVLLDRGLSGATPEMIGEITVTGNLIWPDDVDQYTPPPEGDLWFARDVAAMAQVLGTEPVLITARTATGQGVEPAPVTTEGIPNNHLQYAITWFSLAAIWAGMTVFALWRIRRGTN